MCNNVVLIKIVVTDKTFVTDETFENILLVEGILTLFRMGAKWSPLPVFPL